MSRQWFLSVLSLAIPALLLVQVSSAHFDLAVNEAATTCSLRGVAPQVSLVIDNGSRKELSALVHLELLDPDNKIRATSERKASLTTGSQSLLFNLPMKSRDLTPNARDKTLWYRLYYRITPVWSPNEIAPIEGFISLSEITSDLFELRVVGAGAVREGMLYHVKVDATHPVTHRPSAGVLIKGTMTLDNSRPDNERILLGSSTTNREGHADLEFRLPTNSNTDDVELTIEGSRGLLTVNANKHLDVFNQPYILVSTDKPIYQPGQTIHTRALVFGPSKHASVATPVSLEIRDPENTVVFSADLATSRFGIASAEWAIPDNIRLGDYQLEFTTDDRTSNTVNVRISRYELPTFAVKVNPDHGYYLPGQNAVVEVSADYLFGRSVSRGHVTLVRETERRWNYREQKYETTEGDKYEGDTGTNGVFKARINLSQDHMELKETYYRRFIDLPYAAYFTDPTTNRTEQRRFNLRVTKEPIHVYLIRIGDRYRQNPKLPVRFYVSTFFADGLPVECSVTISQDRGEDKVTTARVLGRVKTSRYGLANVERLKLLNEDFDDPELKFLLTAKDKSGRTGTTAETYQLTSEPTIQIRTTKTLFAPGESIEATIIATEPTSTLTVDLVSDWSVIHSEVIHLRKGRASIVFPYRPSFKDELTIAAYGDKSAGEIVLGTRSVLYPRNRDLKLNLESVARTYRPGEQAQVSFKATSPEGRSVESALGIVVLDKAVDERVRTDQDFGLRYSSFWDDFLGWRGYGESIGTITRRSLEQIDTSKPIASDLDLVAEVLLNQGSGFYPQVFESNNYEKNQVSTFSSLISKQLEPIKSALFNIYEKTRNYPTSDASLRQLLSREGLDVEKMRDPWGTRYRTLFSTEWTSDVLLIMSAGADKRFDTRDDFSVDRFSWRYFRPTGEAMDAAVREYHARTGKFIRDFQTLRTELTQRGINPDTLRDRWSKPYEIEFEVNSSYFDIEVWTTTPASSYQGKIWNGNKFQVWQTRIDYFAEPRAQIDAALAARLKQANTFPANETELREVLRGSGLDLERLSDPWGRPYYATFQVLQSYGDDVRVESRSVYGGLGKSNIVTKPLNRTLADIHLRSGGADLKEGSSDDFDVAHFSATIAEQDATNSKPRPPRISATFSGATGAIAGVVNDPSAAAIYGATVKATRSFTTESFETTTDDTGKYLLRNLPAGVYEVRVDASAFRSSVVTQIIVHSSELVDVNFTLEVGTVTETVTVTSEGSQLNMSNSATLNSSVSRRNGPIRGNTNLAKQQLFTPRLREYFPETLFWQPELTTDKKGRAQIDFKLADNITTWKMSVIGSTEAGEIGMAETEIRAFQPFFAELDPPRVLTEGDRISLPVVLRNYLDKKQMVDLELKPESWFKTLDSNRKRTAVPPGDSANQTFDIQAVASVKDGKQRVTAIGSDLSDAIEKAVTVHPDGEEKAQTTSDLLQTSAEMTIDLPIETIANSAQVELKVYPNLMAHVWESVEAIMKRPYGCGEQTISSTYPSLLVLHYLKEDNQDSPIAEKARRYLQEGYQRLLGYQSSDGGFSYWGHGDSDLALTAYAIRFLHDASEVIQVNDYALQRGRSWLLKQQRPDGSWPALYWDKKEDPRRTAMVTAVVARTLALTKPTQDSDIPTVVDSTKAPLLKSELNRALDYLQRRSEEIDEPYLIASYSLASSLAGASSRAAKANSRLTKLSHTQANETYWALETNTPFYGWGLAGCVETTALAIQALAHSKGADSQEQQNKDLESRGLLFLLRNKDRYGVWYSTQATINVLDAMLALLADQESPEPTGSPSKVEVIVNGQRTTSLELPLGRRMIAPLTADLTAFVKKGTNRIELCRVGSGPAASLQVVSTYYVPWATSATAETPPTPSGDAESLRLETSFDKKEVRVTDEITCKVKAERIGFRGYGMLLAEIGLPPGVDVDRASLETAMRGSDWSISQYDVLPDRVVVYLWPRAGGSSFSFKFKPRLAMTAKSSASRVYDYYNPAARAIVAPSRFVVR